MRSFTLALLFILPFTVSGQVDSFELHQRQYILEVTTNFINLVKNNRRAELAEQTPYPLWRHYPVPHVTSKEDFLNRYTEIFDDSLVKMISVSNAEKDWGKVGSHGIMFLNGEVWLDEDGRLAAVNYQSAVALRKKTQIIEAERKTLHPSIRTYEYPVCILKTSQYQVRIDKVANYKFRYTSWPITGKMSNPPTITLVGDLKYDGSGGNRFYKFKKGSYTYTCYINVIGSDDGPPAELIITKDHKEILHQNAILIGK